MATVLILYPKLFNCYSKFARKVKKITSSLGQVTLVYPNDPNRFIEKISEETSVQVNQRNQVDWNIDDITHAIIFDDGEEFAEETRKLQSSGKPLRLIKVTITRVINIKIQQEYKSLKSTLDYEYIGRGSYWGESSYHVWDRR